MSAVAAVDPRTDARWAELARGPRGSLFTSPAWITAICSTYGFTPNARVTSDGSGCPTAGVCWIDVDDMRGRRRIALPFCDRADPIATDPDQWNAVGIELTSPDIPVALRCLEQSPANLDPRLHPAGQAAWHGTPLDLPLDDLWSRFRSQTRRNIGAAERAGVKVVLTDEHWAIGDYHCLHVGLRKNKYRLLAQPRKFFDDIWEAFAPLDGVHTALAFLDGRPIAGAIYLVWQDTVYYKFGASDSEYLWCRPNDALHWALIQWAHARGLGLLDWGLTDLDQPGLVGYKRKWGSIEGRINTLRSSATPASRPDADRTLGELTRLFTEPEVPDEVTARAGALLYRYFC